MKQTVYFDATIPNYYFDERRSLKTFVDITKKWSRRTNFRIWISEETLDELAAGNYPHKIKAWILRRNSPYYHPMKIS